MDYVILSILWMVWCALHSLLISTPVTTYLQDRWGNRFHYYRLIYNGVALASLLPIVLFAYGLRAEPLFRWEGEWRVMQYLLVFSALFLFVAGARHYDALQFIGLRQIKQMDSCTLLTEDCELDTKGILGLIRHPWYLGAILIIWARDLDLAAILTNIILTGYLVLGTFMEEHKLKDRFGEAYTAYQDRVGMFFPFKAIKSKMKRSSQ
jgi:protein-S-isoprenylcysteine O-methyltransferase Ste14